MMAETDATHHTETKALADMEMAPQANTQVTPHVDMNTTTPTHTEATTTSDMKVTHLVDTEATPPTSTRPSVHTNEEVISCFNMQEGQGDC